METNKTRCCRTCGDVLRGRSDKIFCDDLCRNRHHNQINKKPALSEGARLIQRTLIQNHRILGLMLRSRNKCIVHRDDLLRLGFVFEVMSHRLVDRLGGESTFCLDIGYRLLGDNRVQLFKHKQGLGIFRYWASD